MKFKNFKRITSILLTVLLVITMVPLSAITSSAQETTDTTDPNSVVYSYGSDYDRMSNDFIEVSFKNTLSDYNKITTYSNYTMHTTGGRLDTETDDNLKLLYGYSNATHFSVDGVAKNLQDYNDDNLYYNNTKADIVFDEANNARIMRSDMLGLDIEESIKIIKNPSTGNSDLVEIKYTVTNPDTVSHEVAASIMIDTMLAGNDSAPFRVPNTGDVTTEKIYYGDDIPEYYLALDDLITPTVVSKGTFDTTSNNQPDYVRFVNWNKSRYQYYPPVEEGITIGDSAVVSGWDDKTLYPGETREYKMYYGMSRYIAGDLNGDLYIGAYCAEVATVKPDGSGYEDELVTAFVKNICEHDLTNVEVTINTVPGMNVVGDTPITINIGDLAVGEEASVSWLINFDNFTEDTVLNFDISAEADNAERETAPLQIAIKLPAVDELPEVCTNHNYSDNGFCINLLANGTVCDAYEPCDPVTNENYTVKGLASDYVGYYAIKNAGNLYWFADNVNNDNANFKSANAVVIKNISVNADNISDCEGVNRNNWREWLVIGASNSTSYRGDFDGRDHFVSGLYLNNSTEYAGLFGNVEYSEIKNISLVNSYISGTNHLGGICGSAIYNAVFDNVHNLSTIEVTSGDSTAYVGGIVGDTGYAVITKNSSNSGAVIGKNYDRVGGIAGSSMYGSSINNCNNSGSVTGGGYSYTGGIMGSDVEQGSSKIEKCYNTGTVKSDYGSYTGGICGKSNTGGQIHLSYNKGDVSGGNGTPAIIGGICGHTDGTISVCYNEGTIIGGSYNAVYTAGIAGNTYIHSVIENTYNIGDIQSGGTYIAGICSNNSGKIKNSHNFGNLNNGLSYNKEHIAFNYSSASVENCYYVASSNSTELDTLSGTTCKNYEQFANGEVRDLLNGTTAEADRVWYQHRDGYPAFIDSIVDCETDGHHYENGFCINTRLDGTVCDFYQPAEDTDGDGYYEITNGGNLYWFATQVNDNINTSINGELTNDIYVNKNVLNGDKTLNTAQSYREWLVIGHDDSNAFNGTFDGCNYTISGLYTSTNTNYENVGLFGKATGDIKNVGIKDCYFTCGDNTVQLGGICAYAYHNSITNCYNDGCVVTASTPQRSNIGGICGLPIRVTIKNCYNTGNVTTSSVEGMAGGVFGIPQVCTIENCYNTGTVTAISPAKTAGGFSASNYSPIGTVTTVKNCYNTGTVIGSDEAEARAGGMFGYGSNINMENCYNSGTVTGSDNSHVGGIFGRYYIYETETSTKNCYNTGKITGGDKSYIGGIFGSLHGYVKTHTVDGCYNEGEINGGVSTKVAGVCGIAETHIDTEKPSNIVITNCYNTANVTGGGYSYTAGICGDNHSGSTITNSYNTGNIKAGTGAPTFAGGICAYNKGFISICHNDGNVTSGSSATYPGGIAGYNINATVSNCYNTGKITSSGSPSAGIAQYSTGVIVNCHNYGSASAPITNNFNTSSGTVVNCYYLVADNVTTERDSFDGTTMKTASQFASGEVTYLLNNKVSSSDNIWYQTLGTHDYPIFDAKIVYFGYKSPVEQGYSNDELPTERPDSDVKIVGDINCTLTRIPGSNCSYTGSISLAEGSYNFKVSENSVIWGGKYTINDTTYSNSYPFNYTANATLNATGGNYTFTYNIDTNMLRVSYVSNADVVSLVDPETGADIVKLEKTNGTIYTGLLRQSTPKDITFKVNDNGTLRGLGYTFVDTEYPEGLISNIDYSGSWVSPTTLRMSGGVYAFTYDTATKYLSISYRPADSETVSLFGDVNLELKKDATTENIYVATRVLNEGVYVFRIDEFGTVMCNGDTIDNASSSIPYNSAWNRPTILKASGGSYTFRYNASSDTLSIIYSPTVSADVSITFGDTKATLEKQDDANIYTGTVELAAGIYEFNIDEYGVLYRNGSSFTDKIQNIEYRYTWTKDTKFTVTSVAAGTFNIKYNADTKKLWLTPAE